MENKGKQICNYLKEVRRRVAEENDIRLEQHECTFKGECSGTCPRCEAEVRYLEAELGKRMRLGKAASVAVGVTMAAASIASCTEGKVVDPGYGLTGAYDWPQDTVDFPQDTADSSQDTIMLNNE